MVKVEKFYFDNIDIQRRLIISKKRGILDPVVFNSLQKIVNRSFSTFTFNFDREPDIKQDVYLSLLTVWMSYDHRKADPLSYFTEVIKRRIWLSNKELAGGRNKDDFTPKFISFDTLFSTDDP